MTQTDDATRAALALTINRQPSRRRSGPRAALVAALAVLALLVVLDGIVYRMAVTSVEHILADSPALGDALRGQLRLHLFWTIFASAAFFAGLILVGGLEGHRRAGVMTKLVSRLEQVERGELHGELRFRNDDRLEPLELAFNRMSRTLLDRSSHEVERLERLAELATEARTKEELRQLHTEIRELARDKRRLLDNRR